jgi:hypothetical protein
LALHASHALVALGTAEVSQTEATSAAVVMVMQAPQSAPALATVTKQMFGPPAPLEVHTKPSQQSLVCAQVRAQ